MRFARIKNGIVKDVIVVNDTELLPLFSENFDYVIEVFNEPGGVGPKDLYDPNTGFTKPARQQN
jgi:hypothetical protein